MFDSNKLTADVSSFYLAIPSSTRKALIQYWGNEDIVFRPEIIVDLGPEHISRIKRIGRKSLEQIAQALKFSGHIDSPGAWLTKDK